MTQPFFPEVIHEPLILSGDCGDLRDHHIVIRVAPDFRWAGVRQVLIWDPVSANNVLGSLTLLGARDESAMHEGGLGGKTGLLIRGNAGTASLRILSHLYVEGFGDFGVQFMRMGRVEVPYISGRLNRKHVQLDDLIAFEARTIYGGSTWAGGQDIPSLERPGGTVGHSAFGGFAPGRLRIGELYAIGEMQGGAKIGSPADARIGRFVGAQLYLQAWQEWTQERGGWNTQETLVPMPPGGPRWEIGTADLDRKHHMNPETPRHTWDTMLLNSTMGPGTLRIDHARIHQRAGAGDAIQVSKDAMMGIERIDVVGKSRRGRDVWLGMNGTLIANQVLADPPLEVEKDESSSVWLRGD